MSIDYRGARSIAFRVATLAAVLSSAALALVPGAAAASTNPSFSASSVSLPGTFSGVNSVDLAPETGSAADLLISATDGTNSRFLIAAGHGDGTFGAPAAAATSDTGAAANAQTTVIGTDAQGRPLDFNRDGIHDVLVLHSFQGNPEVMLGAADGSYTASATLPASSGIGSPQQVTVADLNGDGKLDVAIAEAGEDTVDVYLGNGDGTFSHTPYTVACASTIAAGDVNGDSFPDLVVGLNPNQCLSGSASTDDALAVLVNHGGAQAGTFAAASDIAQSGSTSGGDVPQSVTTGDFNGDGKADVAYVSDNANGTVTVVDSHGDGTFAAARSYSIAQGGDIVAGGAQIVAADLNGDGLPDLATVTTSHLVVLTGNNDGSFTVRSGIALTGSGYTALAANDIDGDDLPDLVAGSGTEAAVQVLRNTTPAPPSVQVVGAPSVGTTTATLEARINPRGQATTYHFSYGTSVDQSGWTTVPVPDGTLAAASNPQYPTVDLTGLTPGTTYHWTVSATNATGTAVAPVLGQFTTATPGSTATGQPTESIQLLYNGQSYDPTQPGVRFPYGARVEVLFTCNDYAGGPGIASCSGDLTSATGVDTPISGGAFLPTNAPGRYAISLKAVENGALNTPYTIAGSFTIDPATTATVSAPKITAALTNAAGSSIGGDNGSDPNAGNLATVGEGDPVTLTWGCTTTSDGEAGIRSCTARLHHNGSAPVLGRPNTDSGTATVSTAPYDDAARLYTVVITATNVAGTVTQRYFDYQIATPPSIAAQQKADQQAADELAQAEAAAMNAQNHKGGCSFIATAKKVDAGVYCDPAPALGGTLYALPGYELVGGPLKLNAAGQVIAAGSGNVIGAGAGNVIAAGAGNVIGAGAGNVIAAGSGNVILVTADEAKLISDKGLGLISDKGLGLISDKGLGVIAAGAGNVIAAGAGNVIGAGAGNLIARNGSNVIGAGAGNLVLLEHAIDSDPSTLLGAVGVSSLIAGLQNTQLLASSASVIGAGAGNLTGDGVVHADGAKRVKRARTVTLARGSVRFAYRKQRLALVVTYTRAGRRIIAQIAKRNAARRRAHRRAISLRLTVVSSFEPKGSKHTVTVRKTFTVTPGRTNSPRPK